MTIKTVLFDLDDTLMEEERSAKRAFYSVCDAVEKEYGIPVDEFYASIRESSRSIWHTCPVRKYCLNIGISSWEGLWADFTGDDEHLKILYEWKMFYRQNSWGNALKKFNIDNNSFADSIEKLFIEERKSIQVLFPEVLEMLGTLKGHYKLGMITNGAPDLQIFKINSTKLACYFSSILISGAIGTGKPALEIFRKALRDLNSESSETVMIGDSISTDIAGAKNMSIKTIWVNRRGNVRKTDMKPDLTVKNLENIEREISSVWLK